MTLTRLPPIRQLTADSAGVGYYLCQQKDVRAGRNGDFIAVTLLDATGRIAAKIFDDVDRLRSEFEEGEFVKARARANLYGGRLQLIVENIRRINPEQDRALGFREEDCVPSAPRPIDEMWAELQALVASMRNTHLQHLVTRILACHGESLRTWPAAQVIHHAYRGGYLEHVLKIAETSRYLAAAYGGDPDLLLVGAILHDIGKLQELTYDGTTTYSREGRLLGHITLGTILVRDVAMGMGDFPAELLTQVEHLVLSHHGSRDLGSPVEPMTVEAFILSMADDLDAKIHQVRSAIAEDVNEGEFTAYQQRLGRVLWKGTK
ncbi:MAG: 3'-5' exoribonuclease YhaM family protein [Bacteroidales bacterium]